MSLRASVWTWEQELPPTAKLVLLVLADHAHDNGTAAYPSVATISRKTGISTRQIQRILGELVNQRVIRIQRQGGRGQLRYGSTWYALNIEQNFAISRSDFRAAGCPPELRAMVIVRDDFTCQLCRRDGDEMIGPDGAPWEVDRIQSGHYEPDNVRLTCRDCNRRRGQPGKGRHDVAPGSRGDTEGARGDTESTSGATRMSPEPSLEPKPFPPSPPEGGVGGSTRKRRDVSEHDPAWVAFWAAYPRRVGKGAARKAYARALGKTTPEAILTGARRVTSDYEARKAAPRPDDRGADPLSFVPHPVTWLNQERWDDETDATATPVDGAAARPQNWRRGMPECPRHSGQHLEGCRLCASERLAGDQ